MVSMGSFHPMIHVNTPVFSSIWSFSVDLGLGSCPWDIDQSSRPQTMLWIILKFYKYICTPFQCSWCIFSLPGNETGQKIAKMAWKYSKILENIIEIHCHTFKLLSIFLLVFGATERFGFSQEKRKQLLGSTCDISCSPKNRTSTRLCEICEITLAGQNGYPAILAHTNKWGGLQTSMNQSFSAFLFPLSPSNSPSFDRRKHSSQIWMSYISLAQSSSILFASSQRFEKAEMMINPKINGLCSVDGWFDLFDTQISLSLIQLMLSVNSRRRKTA